MCVYFPPLLGLSIVSLRVRLLVSEEMSSSTYNLLVSYDGKLVKWNQGVFDSRYIGSQLTNTTI